MRKHYLDNIRSIIILLLFPYHTFMIWNDFGDKFYIWGGNNNIISCFIVLLSPWLMPVLFVIAGMSARYSSAKRNTSEFIKERTAKLLIPFAAGLLLLVPFQTLYARKFFFGYNGGIMENFKYFFTHLSDLNGYDGGFTPGHLWFLLYLYIIAVLSVPVIKKLPYAKASAAGRINIFGIILLFIPVYIFCYIGNIGGKSIGKYMLLYMMGFYCFSDEFIEKVSRYKAIVLSLFSVSQILLAVLYFKFGYYGDLLVNFVCWSGVLSCIITGKLFFDRENSVTRYFKRASFPIYILHQNVLVAVGYYVMEMTDKLILQAAVIMSASFIITVMIYEMISRASVLRNKVGSG